MVKVAFITVLTCSNFSGAAKQAVVDLPQLGPVPFGALAFACFMANVLVNLPPGPSEYMKSYPPALEAVFGNPWRIA